MSRRRVIGWCLCGLMLVVTRARADSPPPAAALVSFRTAIGMPPPIDYTITVYADGRVEAAQRLGYRRAAGETTVLDYQRKPKVRQRMLAPEALAPLLALLHSAELARLEPAYTGRTWDVANYDFTVTLPDGTRRTITTRKLTAGQLPGVLQKLMGELRRLAAGLFQG